jgi:hypothetical protein
MLLSSTVSQDPQRDEGDPQECDAKEVTSKLLLLAVLAAGGKRKLD